MFEWKDVKNNVDNVAWMGSPSVTEFIESAQRSDFESLAGDRDFMEDLINPVKKISTSLNEDFIEREDMIEMSLSCFIGHLPMIALGPPGTAKSLIIRQMSKMLGLAEKKTDLETLKRDIESILEMISDGDAKGSDFRTNLEGRGYFEYLVTRYTTPDEIIGPANLDVMIKAALYFRETTGLLPEANVAFLDEIFKANSAILNALLSILNERLFYNAGQAATVPLCMVFGASNEPPQEEELWALYDRFPVRVLCNPVDEGNLENLLDKIVEQHDARLFREKKAVQNNKKTKVEMVASVNHFRLLYRLTPICEKMWNERTRNEFRKSFVKIFVALRREFGISDRSMGSLYRLCRPLALVRGRNDPTRDELEVFKYCFRRPEEAPVLAAAVDDMVFN